MNFILLGPPGSGKGTQGEYLEKITGAVRLSTGDLLRDEISRQTEVGKKIQHLIEAGKFATDDIIISLVESRIKELVDSGFILDGFPRNLKQAEWLNSVLEKLSVHIDHVLNFEVSEEVVVERISSRYFCATCKATYNKMFHNPQKEGVCDVCGSHEFLVRSDDKPDVVRGRFADYNSKTLPLVDYYRGLGVLYNIDASGDIKEIRKKIDFLVSKSR